mmetsp:Transcript_71703/g.180933  ORF Transcript_71703/g.180933 Transcript_71703/m.180933 type:complete len:225 (-) Transcript_71703:719-1393(-)
MVDTSEGTPCVDVVHAPIQALQSHVVRACIEVPDQYDRIVRMRSVCNELQDVVRGRLTSASATAVHRQRAMMVHEEEHLSSGRMLQASPHDGSSAVPLVTAVLADVFSSIRQQGPTILAIRHAHCVRPSDCPVLCRKASIAKNPTDTLAFLEAHDVEPFRAARLGNEPARAAAITVSSAEQVPPKQVVCEHLHGDAAARATTPEGPTLLRFVHAAPLALRHDTA